LLAPASPYAVVLPAVQR